MSSCDAYLGINLCLHGFLMSEALAFGPWWKEEIL